MLVLAAGAVPAMAQSASQGVATTVIGGDSPVPGERPAPSATSGGHHGAGAIELTVTSVDVATLARIVLKDTLHVPYSLLLDRPVTVSLATAGAVTRNQLLDLFEAALRKADLAMVWQGNGYRIETLSDARADSAGLLPDRGFGSEVIALRFANADEIRKLLDSIDPGAVQSVDAAHNSLTIAGTEAQRKGVHGVIDQFDVDWLKAMAFALYVPQHTDSRLIVPELDRLINAPGAPTHGMVRLIAMDKLDGVIAISPQRQYLEDVRRWVEVLDREGVSSEPRLFVYRVQNGRSRDLVRTINATFGIGTSNGAPGESSAEPEPASVAEPAANAPSAPTPTTQRPARTPLAVRISSDDLNNAVVIYASPHDFAMVEDALRRLDVAPAQVLIEAAITEVDLNDDMRFGVQWNFTNATTSAALSEGSSATPTQTFPGFSWFYSKGDIAATLNALEARTKLKVVSAPKLMVLNNQTAALQVGEQVPIETQTAQSTVTSTSSVVSSIEYKDTGVLLKITPRVNASGTVLLDIAQEVSDVATTTSSSINSPTISTRKIQTTIAVQDSQVVALGGLFRNSKTVEREGLPVLSRIPVLGGLLFGKTTNTLARTELLVLIKPHVLRHPEDIAGVTEELRERITSVEPFGSRGRIP